MILGLIIGGIVVGTFGVVFYIVVKGERELDKAESEPSKH
jgi:heme/copper-type cytochrome/quinol oxidase subunit 2